MTACRPIGVSLVAVLLALFAPAHAAGQVTPQPNSPEAALTFNDIDEGSYPIQVEVLGPSLLTISISGAGGNLPFLLAGSADIVVPGIPVAPGLVINIDLPTHFEIFNGLTPAAAPMHPFAVLNSAGMFNFGFPVPHPGSSPIVVGGFQAALVDPTQPSGKAVSAATRLILVPTPTLTNFAFGGGTDTDHHTVFTVTVPNSSVPLVGVSPDFDANTVKLAGFQQFDETATAPLWQNNPAALPVSAVNVNENEEFTYIKTLHGDLYLIEENAPLVRPGGNPGGHARLEFRSRESWNGATASQFLDSGR